MKAQAAVKVTLPVRLNSKFIIGPEGAHLNISGISGLAAKTSYAMFLMKAIQDTYIKNKSEDESVAFVMFNVKSRDLLTIDQPNDYDDEDDPAKKRLKMKLCIKSLAFRLSRFIMSTIIIRILPREAGTHI